MNRVPLCPHCGRVVMREGRDYWCLRCVVHVWPIFKDRKSRAAVPSVSAEP